MLWLLAGGGGLFFFFKKVRYYFWNLWALQNQEGRLPTSGSAAFLLVHLFWAYRMLIRATARLANTWNTSLAPALRLFRTWGIFTNCDNISAEVQTCISISGCLSFCNGKNKPGVWLRRVKLRCCFLRSRVNPMRKWLFSTSLL